MTGREPERTATAAAHPFTRPGQVAGRPAPDKCMTCGQPEAAHWLPTGAELAEARAEKINQRLDRIRALTGEQCRQALIFLDGYEPQGVDFALDGVERAVVPMCPEGCGCRLDGEDADRRECGCDGPCTGESNG